MRRATVTISDEIEDKLDAYIRRSIVVSSVRERTWYWSEGQSARNLTVAVSYAMLCETHTLVLRRPGGHTLTKGWKKC
jgi:hypothetical protein